MNYYFCYMLLLAAFIFSLYAQIKVSTTYSKYNKHSTMSGLTGAEAARYILDSKGLYSVSIEHISGHLSDHYDPRTQTLRLSDSVYGSRSVAAIGVAAHECGHAIQHAEKYSPLTLRMRIVGITNICSRLSFILILFGAILDIFFYTASTTGAASIGFLFQIAGVLAFAVVTFFQLITLPVEFDASSRAINIIEKRGILAKNEIGGAKKVLSAAAMTYLAALAVSLLQLLRLIIMITGGRRRR